jgi:AcrR family transcriptional regulator
MFVITHKGELFMKQSKIDSRIIYTKSQLKKSFISLAGSKNIYEITIKELCDEALINRNTFYAHYVSVGALQQEIEDEFFETITNYFNVFLANRKVSDLLLHVCLSIEASKEFCKYAFSEYCNMSFPKRVLAFVKNKILDVALINLDPQRKILVEKLYTFGESGCLETLKRWIFDECRESPRSISAFLYDCSTAVLNINKVLI